MTRPGIEPWSPGLLVNTLPSYVDNNNGLLTLEQYEGSHRRLINIVSSIPSFIFYSFYLCVRLFKIIPNEPFIIENSLIKERISVS